MGEGGNPAEAIRQVLVQRLAERLVGRRAVLIVAPGEYLTGEIIESALTVLHGAEGFTSLRSVQPSEQVRQADRPLAVEVCVREGDHSAILDDIFASGFSVPVVVWCQCDVHPGAIGRHPFDLVVDHHALAVTQSEIERLLPQNPATLAARWLVLSGTGGVPALVIAALEAGSRREGLKAVIQVARDYLTLFTCTPYAINTHRLLVRGERVPYTPEIRKEADKQTSEPAMEPWQWWLIAGAAVGLAALIFFVLRDRRRRKAKPAAPLAPAANEGDEKSAAETDRPELGPKAPTD